MDGIFVIVRSVFSLQKNNEDATVIGLLSSRRLLSAYVVGKITLHVWTFTTGIVAPKNLQSVLAPD
jgi:hypothetical protein